MTEKINKDGIKKVYEIGYLLVSSIPEEKVGDEVTTLRNILEKKGAEFIAEEAPELRTLAYTMTKKIGASNHRFDRGYFGWFKFSLSSMNAESVKKSFEELPHMLRMIFIATVKEGTYLGKKSPSFSISKTEEVVPEVAVEVVASTTEASVAPVSVEEIDKSIDEMVKEA